MNITQLKSKITKILKQNDFKKSEIIKEWNHPKHKCAGFEYWIGNDINFGLSYFVPNGVFTEEEQQKFINNKVNEMYDVLVKAGLKEYMHKWDYSITITANP